MDYKMKLEINNLVKAGIPEDLALICICRKYKKEYLVEDILLEKKQEQELLREELSKFSKFVLDGGLDEENLLESNSACGRGVRGVFQTPQG
jgi:hypothetical protein